MNENSFKEWALLTKIKSDMPANKINNDVQIC